VLAAQVVLPDAVALPQHSRPSKTCAYPNVMIVIRFKVSCRSAVSSVINHNAGQCKLQPVAANPFRHEGRVAVVTDGYPVTMQTNSGHCGRCAIVIPRCGARERRLAGPEVLRISARTDLLEDGIGGGFALAYCVALNSWGMEHLLRDRCTWE
jgi:hypothetical protein